MNASLTSAELSRLPVALTVPQAAAVLGIGTFQSGASGGVYSCLGRHAMLPGRPPRPVRAWSRAGNDITSRFPELAAIGQLSGPSKVLDGELVVIAGDRSTG
jgi:hypothetical protein